MGWTTNLNWWVDPGILKHQQYFKRKIRGECLGVKVSIRFDLWDRSGAVSRKWRPNEKTEDLTFQWPVNLPPCKVLPLEKKHS